MQDKFDDNGLLLAPINFAEDAWAYEQRGGLEIFFDMPKAQQHKNAFVGKIDVRAVRAYLRRLDAKKKRAKS